MTTAIQKPRHSPEAARALEDLFFIVERLDRDAHEPGPDGMVKVTAQLWRHLMTPRIQAVRQALDAEAGR